MDEVTNKTSDNLSQTIEQLENPIKLSIAKSSAEFVYDLTYLRVNLLHLIDIGF